MNISRFNTYGSNMIEKTDTQKDDSLNIEKINSIKIDDILFDKKISLMKIDVQGYDLEVLKEVGISAMPCSSPILDKFNPDYITKRKGGDGSFREFIDLILENRK